MERRRDDCDGRDSTSFFENRREGQGDNDGIYPPDQVDRSSSRHDNGVPSPSGAPSPRPNEKRLSLFHRWKMECCDGCSLFAFRFFFGHCSLQWKGRWGALPCMPAVVRCVTSSSVVRVEDSISASVDRGGGGGGGARGRRRQHPRESSQSSLLSSTTTSSTTGGEGMRLREFYLALKIRNQSYVHGGPALYMQAEGTGQEGG
jgi:hypothetical protein